MISKSEKQFIQNGIFSGIRADGRSSLDNRMSFFTTGLLPQASGSCQVKVNDGSDVLVGVKVKIENNLQESFFNISVDCSPSVSKFMTQSQIQTMTAEYSEFITRLLNQQNSTSLILVPDKLFWIIHIDILIMEYGGNLLDTCISAVRGALFNTRIPKVTIETSEGHHEFDVADEETESLLECENIPISVTFYKIENRYIVDASPMEESCSDASITICYNAFGNICAMKKSGFGGIEPSLLSSIIEAGKPFGSKLINSMEIALKREENNIL